ncbi:hypothetical protein NMG60_11037003 [Bertholletia excelsa]
MAIFKFCLFLFLLILSFSGSDARWLQQFSGKNKWPPAREMFLESPSELGPIVTPGGTIPVARKTKRSLMETALAILEARRQVVENYDPNRVSPGGPDPKHHF